MELKVIGSSSKGNGYILKTSNKALFVECGVSSFEMLREIHFNTFNVSVALISHEHSDHSKDVHSLIENGIKVCCSLGTAKALQIEKNVIIAQDCKPITFDCFTVTPFKVEHDASEPMGFIIENSESGKILFVTDTKTIPDFAMKQVYNNILIECNYSLDKLKENVLNGVVNQHLAKRISQSHLSLETCIDTFLKMDLSKLINVVVIHSSDTNSERSFFIDCIKRVVKPYTNIVLAKKNLSLKLNKQPF